MGPKLAWSLGDLEASSEGFVKHAIQQVGNFIQIREGSLEVQLDPSSFLLRTWGILHIRYTSR